LNEVQRTAIAAAKAAMRPAMELYENRNHIALLVGKLELRDLKRLVSIVKRLTPADWRELAAQAESLADWNGPQAESPDAPLTKQDPAAATGGTGA
jgi:hypothetical protein